jgi:hypothetical protein
MGTRLHTSVGGLDYALDIQLTKDQLDAKIREAQSRSATVDMPLKDRVGHDGTLWYDGRPGGSNSVTGNVDLGPDGLPMSGNMPID